MCYILNTFLKNLEVSSSLSSAINMTTKLGRLSTYKHATSGLKSFLIVPWACLHLMDCFKFDLRHETGRWPALQMGPSSPQLSYGTVVFIPSLFLEAVTGAESIVKSLALVMLLMVIVIVCSVMGNMMEEKHFFPELTKDSF